MSIACARVCVKNSPIARVTWTWMKMGRDIEMCHKRCEHTHIIRLLSLSISRERIFLYIFFVISKQCCVDDDMDCVEPMILQRPTNRIQKETVALKMRKWSNAQMHSDKASLMLVGTFFFLPSCFSYLRIRIRATIRNRERK